MLHPLVHMDKPIFVDATYFLRLLLAGGKGQRESAQGLFVEAAEGQVKLMTSTLVLFELYWALSAQFEKQTIVDVLDKIVTLPLVALEERPLLHKAVALFAKPSLRSEAKPTSRMRDRTTITEKSW
jgi:predicted nucleic acid-binding protein